MEAVAEDEISVVLSSHVVSDLERVCDHLVVLVDSQVRVAGDVEELLATHHRLSGPRRDPDSLPGRPARRVGQPHRPAVDATSCAPTAPILDPAWTVTGAGPGGPGAGLHGGHRVRRARPAHPGGAPMIWLTWRQLRRPARSRSSSLVAAACVVARAHRPAAGRPGPPQRGRLRPADQHRPAPLQRRHRGARGGAGAARRLLGRAAGGPGARDRHPRLVWNQSVTRGPLAGRRSSASRSSPPRSRSGVLTAAVTWWARPARRRAERHQRQPAGRG